jgi:hypothetical protein
MNNEKILTNEEIKKSLEQGSKIRPGNRPRTVSVDSLDPNWRNEDRTLKNKIELLEIEMSNINWQSICNKDIIIWIGEDVNKLNKRIDGILEEVSKIRFELMQIRDCEMNTVREEITR